jgi:hypothetical protein
MLATVPQIDAIEVWNQPDNPAASLLNWRGGKDGYRDLLLIPGFEAAKDAKPSVLVAAPNTGRNAHTKGSMKGWIEVNETQPVVALDALSMHIYGTVASIKNITNDFIPFVKERYIQSFWISEFGWGGTTSICPKTTTGNIGPKINAVRDFVIRKNQEHANDAVATRFKAFIFPINGRQPGGAPCTGLQHKNGSVSEVYAELLAYQSQLDNGIEPNVSYVDTDYGADNDEDDDPS